MVLELPNCMRLSAKKVAHLCSRPVLRCRKSGKRSSFSWFSPKENHTSRSLSGHSNCETALMGGSNGKKRLCHIGDCHGGGRAERRGGKSDGAASAGVLPVEEICAADRTAVGADAELF